MGMSETNREVRLYQETDEHIVGLLMEFVYNKKTITAVLSLKATLGKIFMYSRIHSFSP